MDLKTPSESCANPHGCAGLARLLGSSRDAGRQGHGVEQELLGDRAQELCRRGRPLSVPWSLRVEHGAGACMQGAGANQQQLAWGHGGWGRCVRGPCCIAAWMLLEECPLRACLKGHAVLCLLCRALWRWCAYNEKGACLPWEAARPAGPCPPRPPGPCQHGQRKQVSSCMQVGLRETESRVNALLYEESCK